MNKITLSELEKIANNPATDEHYQECYDIFQQRIKNNHNDIIANQEKYQSKDKKFLGMRLNSIRAGMLISLTALAVYLHDGHGREWRERMNKNYLIKNQEKPIEFDAKYNNNVKTLYDAFKA
jgi:hypothetical protein